MEETVRDRITLLIKDGNSSINSISNGDKAFQRRLNRQINEGASVTFETISSILKVFPNISAEWLIRGEGPMLKSENPQPVINYESKGAPYYSVDFIGGFDLITNNQTIYPDYYIDFPPYNKEGVVWCNVTGHSMEPEIYHGDIIALRDTNETNPNYLPFGEVYALVTKNYRTIKRLSKSEQEGFIKLVPTNPSPEYTAQDIPIDSIIKIYQVLVSVKRF